MIKRLFLIISICIILAYPVYGAVYPVFYSWSPYSTGDIKTCQGDDCGTYPLTLTINSGVATLSYAQANNIGAGCRISFGAGPTYVYICPNRLGFDSGSTEPKPGDKVQGDTSGATGIIRAVQTDGGTWGPNAYGYIYFSETTGTWQNNENIDLIKPSSSANIATVDGTLQGNIGNGNTQFVVKDADASETADVGSSQTVNSISHEWASLSALEQYFTDGSHVGNTDLTAVDVCVYGCAYYDHDDYTADTTAFNIDYGTSDSDSYLFLFTPTGNSESINDQRHPGYWDDNKFKFEINNAYSYISENYTRFEGTQLKFLNATTSTKLVIIVNGPDYVRIYKNLFRGAITGNNASTCCYSNNLNTDDFMIYNNLFYDWLYSTNDITAVQIKAVSAHVYNNTFHNCYNAIENIYTSAIIDVKNNLMNDCTNDLVSSYFDTDTTYNVVNASVSGGAIGATADSGNCDGIGSDTNKLRDTGQNFQTTVQVGCIVKNTTDTSYSYVTVVDSDTELTLYDDIMDDGEDFTIYTNMYGSVTFENEGGSPPNFHLGSSDTVAIDKGTDLSSDAHVPMWSDIDGEARGSSWDVGFDEYIAPAGGLSIPIAIYHYLHH